jgi:NADH:ubiquinone oxidoreductase subunit 5 (subunit L)/multisubunit Na+/H+ antiporter MnhA subunit
MESARMNKHYIRDTWDGKDPSDAVNNDADFHEAPKKFRAGAICLIVLAVIFAAIFSPKVRADIACTKIDDQSAHVCWTPSTQFTDGTAIAAGTLVTYTIYTGPRSNVTAAIASTTTALELVFSQLTTGEHCYAVTASIAGVQPSALSNIGCKTIRDPGPTDGSIVPSP